MKNFLKDSEMIEHLSLRVGAYVAPSLYFSEDTSQKYKKYFYRFLINKRYWGQFRFETPANTSISAALAIISHSKDSSILPTLIKEMSEKGHSPRMITYWLREAKGIKGTQLAKILNTPVANIYRWLKIFKENEMLRREFENEYWDEVKFHKYVYYKVGIFERKKKLYLKMMEHINGRCLRHHRKAKT